MEDADVGPGVPTQRKKSIPANAAAPKEKTPEQKLSQVSCHDLGFNHSKIEIFN